MSSFCPKPYKTSLFTEIHGKNDMEKRINACKWLITWLNFQKVMGRKGCVIFDIDQTLIDEDENPLEPIVDVLQLTLRLKFIPIIITARPDFSENVEYTTQLLKALDLKYERLFMMPHKIDPTYETISTYKRSARNVVAKEFDIIANIGDMWTDFVQFPLEKNKFLINRDRDACAIFFPENEHEEVSVKIPSS